MSDSTTLITRDSRTTPPAGTASRGAPTAAHISNSDADTDARSRVANPGRQQSPRTGQVDITTVRPLEEVATTVERTATDREDRAAVVQKSLDDLHDSRDCLGSVPRPRRERTAADVPHRERRARPVRLVRLGRSLRAPRIGTTLAIGTGVLLSLAPGLLPRTPMAQAVLTGLLVAVLLGITGIGRSVLRRCGALRERPRWRMPVLGATTLLIAGAAVHAGHWQNRLRAAMGTPAIGPDYWLWCALGATMIAGLLYGLARGIGWVVRTLGRPRTIAVGVAAAAVLGLVGVPSIVEWRRGAYATANAAMDPAVPRPVSATRSGSAESVVSWPSLGAEGRRFVSGAPVGPVRVYVGVQSAPDLDSRVALAVRELERSGGLTRSHVVIAVPTGSGWIDANAIEGLDDRFHGDVALVGLQYSYAPSWATFLFGREAATESARALFTAVEQRIATLETKPRLHVYGQSLGALGGSAIFADAAEQDRRTCSVLWAGPPVGSVHRSGATVLANTSDPVVHWSPSLLWRAPDLRGARVDAPVPGWLPVASFVQTTADLLAALDAPPGHGHRYGADQGTALPDC
ncbi:alpha/beta-hydrolase family protein [Nocardia cyriacigeorgica]|uniref:alpha/beta-hydrolase family protein n=1 Tax=Nocardia cyriacigeorgica TaxID=135487 RepID=UPI001E30FFB0|nr:alpha/beta-hydrolase family protein [Nocardia cyriacigeorgica]